MAQSIFRRCTCTAIVLSAMLSTVTYGARPSEELLPADTKGYLSAPNMDELQKSWNETQLGKLTNDPVMKPFIEDLQRQIKSRLTQSGIRLGISWEDLQGVAKGEVAVASVQPKGEKNRGATVLLADVTGRRQQIDALLLKISKDLISKGAREGSQSIGGVSFQTFTLAKKKPTDKQAVIYYAVHQDQLLVTDDPDVCKDMMGRYTGSHGDSLANLPAFSETQQRTKDGFNVKPHVRWFIEPFGYTEVVRAYAGGRKKRGTDMLKVLSEQGFNCVQGLGGHVAFATGQHELHHRSFVYAPPVKRQPGDVNQSKYNLAARMLEFPSTEQLVPQDWIPKRLATYLTFNWKVQQAFWHSETLVNGIAGADVFRDVLNDIEKDPNGPQINVQKEFVRFLGERITVVSDYREPIDTKSERVILAIEVTDPAAVMAAVNKTMRSDRKAKEIKLKDHIIWEITQEEEFKVQTEEIKIEGNSLDGLGADNVAPVEDKKFRPNAAVTVAHGQFIIGTHVDYVVDMLTELDKADRLSSAADFARVDESLKKLGANVDSFRCFSRTDHASRVTYEMIRQGKMPEAESLLAKLLNGLFAPEDEDSLRPQQIDGAKLPEFEKVQPYLGPSGFFVKSDDNGWSIDGCLLNKAAQ